MGRSREEYEALDGRILKLSRRGQQSEACELLISSYGPEILGTCVGRMGDRASGEDAAQDSLARAVVGLESYRGEAGLRPWLHRIAANRCLDLLRSRTSRLQRTGKLVDLDMVAAPSSRMPMEQREEDQETARRLEVARDVLRQIKEPDRTWVELHYTHGVSYDEIAREADLSRAAVKQRIWRAVKRVRAGLATRGERLS